MFPKNDWSLNAIKLAIFKTDKISHLHSISCQTCDESNSRTFSKNISLLPSASVFFTGFWFCDIRPVQTSSNLKIIGNVWTNLMSHPNSLYLEHKHFSELQASCVSSSCRPNTTDCVTRGPWWIKIPKCKMQWQPQSSIAFQYFIITNEYKSTAKTITSASCLRSVCPHIIMQQSPGRNISL